MKTHTTKGAMFLSQVPDMKAVIPFVRSHHERWDGTGYPDGLKADQNPQLARIEAVAEAFDAMTSDEPYRRAINVDSAYGEILRQAGTQFDPEVARIFLSMRDRVS